MVIKGNITGSRVYKDRFIPDIMAFELISGVIKMRIIDK
jgi:hypothetical protein